MKNAHPIITAAPSSSPSCLVEPDSSSSSEPAEPIIRLRLDKPLHWEWELTTSADALPVIQLLDKDGRLLVETTGRTAQRARGSFREGLRTHEEFPTSGEPSVSTSFSSSSTPSTVVLFPAPGNRNADGFSTKFGTVRFGYQPRKSKSDVTVKEHREEKRKRRRRNRHSSEREASREGEERASWRGKYSVGDYLRRQIIDDLTNESHAARSPEEVARERCRKVKAYLRSRSETLPRLVHVEEEESDRNWRPSVDTNHEDRIRSEKIKEGLARLREAIREKNEKRKRGERGDHVKSERGNSSMNNAESRDASDGTTKSVADDANVENCTRIRNEELERVRSFLKAKIQERMELERCNMPPAWATGVGIQKRYSDYRRPEDPRGYRTRKVRSETSIIRFDPEILQKDRQKGSGGGGGRQVERERGSRAGRSRSKDSFGQKARRRSRSETILEAAETTATNRSGRQWAETRQPAEKRKFYRKTKSDVLLGQMTGSLNSEQEKPPRRARSQDTVDESWREYKERKKHERLHRESEVKEEDFMSKPRWKDLQTALCSANSNCRICQNLQNCVNPSSLNQKQRISPENRPSLADGSRGSCVSRTSNDSGNERPSTSLQENYLVVDKKTNATKAQANSHETNVNSPDCGYSTIPKKTFNDYKELYARSNVKKSDTFKIVDGSEELASLEEDTEVRSEDSNENHNGESVDRFDCPSQHHGGLLTNKSNEDIARDYFKRVYELLKRRQEQARKMAERQEVTGCDDSSSSNYTEKVQKRRLRRKKKERDTQGIETTVASDHRSGQRVETTCSHALEYSPGQLVLANVFYKLYILIGNDHLGLHIEAYFVIKQIRGAKDKAKMASSRANSFAGCREML
ncbi:unnamed protein product, partial [Heterotrigona itama]